MTGSGFEQQLSVMRAAFDELLALAASLDDSELLALSQQLESFRRRTETFDHVLVAELDRREILARELVPSAAGLLSQLLNIAPAEAKRRVEQARELSARQTLTGDRLPPLWPVASSARTAGSISTEHVAIISKTLHKLPSSLAVESVDAAEALLTDWATKVTPPELARIAVRLRDTLDPDGTLSDSEDHRRRRALSLTPEPDGMHRLTGLLDPKCAAAAYAVLNSLSAPKPDDAAGTDDRQPAQRRHDALESVLGLALRAGELPVSGGVPATILITVDADQLRERQGLAETSFGQLLPIADALELADQAMVGLLRTGTAGEPLDLHRARRLASPSQALALIARDRGCTFPGCTVPPEWTEKHHIIAWQDGGPTNLDNLCLVCDYHHDNHLKQGWSIVMQAGQPWFKPPPWKDPQQRAIRNEHFRPIRPGVP